MLVSEFLGSEQLASYLANQTGIMAQQIAPIVQQLGGKLNRDKNLGSLWIVPLR